MKNKVRELRRSADLSQEQLAAMVGVHRGTINSIERFKQEPSLSTALRIASVFGKDPRTIFFESDVLRILQ